MRGVVPCFLLLAFLAPALPASAMEFYPITVHPGTDSYPAWSPDSQYLVFSSDRTDDPDPETNDFLLFRAPSAGGTPVQITFRENEAVVIVDRCPAWSPDGSTIVFHSNRSTSSGLGLHTVPSYGGDVTLLAMTPNFLMLNPSWSPDGSKIAFIGWDLLHGFTFGVYTVNVDGGSQSKLTDGGSVDSEVAWSPDGSSIAYNHNRGIYLIPAAGGTPYPLISTGGTSQIRDASWSPDGSTIVFAWNYGGDYNLWLIPVASGGQMQFTDDPGNEVTPAWSPDGTRIAFSSDRDGDYDIYTSSASAYVLDSFVCDDSAYQNGTDVAHISMTTVCQWGTTQSVQLDLTLKTGFVEPIHVGSDVFTIGPEQSHISQMTFALPADPLAREYEAEVTLARPGGSPVLFTRTFRPAFFGSPMLPPDVLFYQARVEESFFDAGMNCALETASVVPMIGIAASTIQFADQMVIASSFFRRGEREKGWAAWLAGMDRFGSVVLGALSFHIGGEVGQLIDLSDALGTVRRISSECNNQWMSEHLSGSWKSARSGSLADSLAVWLDAALDSTGVEPADVVFVEGAVDLWVEANGSWARQDSTGLVSASFAHLDTLAAVAMVSRSIHHLDHDTAVNPDSQSEVWIRSIRDQELLLGFWHYVSDSERVLRRIPVVDFPEGAVAVLYLARSDDFPLCGVDLEGDGYFEEQLLSYDPDTLAGVGETAPRWRGFDLQVYPTPFNPRITIAFSLDRPARGVLRMVDTAGRFVQVLAVGDFPAGHQQYVWTGRDERGRRVASGTYLCVLECEGVREVRRAVLVR